LQADSGESWYNLGGAQLKLNDYAAAEAAYTRAIAADSTVAKYRHGRGAALYKRRQYAAAVAEWQRAVGLDSLFAPARFSLGNALLRSGQPEEGRRQLALYNELEKQEKLLAGLRTTLIRMPDKAELYHKIGALYGQRGQYDQAHLYYVQALDRNPNFAPSYHNLGNLYLRRGQVTEALSLFRQARYADSTYVLAHLALGNALMMQQAFAQALASYERGLHFEPDNARLQRGAALARKFGAASQTPD